MKLARVLLSVAHRLPGMDAERYELTEDDCASMRFDPDTWSLVFGTDATRIHWDKVIKWEPSDVELECPDCRRTFKSGQALGGHRKHCPEAKKEPA